MATDRTTEDGIDETTAAGEDPTTAGANAGAECDTVVLDAREVEGGPFDDIVAALESLGTDEELLLINGFEPEPLYDILERRGFAFETTRVGDDEYHVRIRQA